MNHINTAVPGGLLYIFCIMAGAPKGILSPEGNRRPAGGRGYGFSFLYPINPEPPKGRRHLSVTGGPGRAGWRHHFPPPN